jgi:hypothetical protein
MIVAEFRIDDAAAIVDHHFLVERGAQRLRDAAFDLAAALHRIGDAAGIGGLHALQDLEFAGALFTATRKPCTLKATERGVPDELPLALSTLPSALRGRGEQGKGRAASGADRGVVVERTRVRVLAQQ